MIAASVRCDAGPSPRRGGATGPGWHRAHGDLLVETHTDLDDLRWNEGLADGVDHEVLVGELEGEP